MGAFSAGMIGASARDLAKYRRAVFTSPLVSDQLRSSVTQVDKLADGVSSPYALGGLYVGEKFGRLVYHHNGETPGFTSYHAYLPSEDITIVVLVNSQSAPVSATNLGIKILREVLDVTQPETTLVAADEAELAKFVGRYDLGPFRMPFGDFLTIATDDNTLQLQINQDDSAPAFYPLSARSDGSFQISGDDETTIRFIGEAGTVMAVEMVTPTATFTGSRIAAPTH